MVYGKGQTRARPSQGGKFLPPVDARPKEMRRDCTEENESQELRYRASYKKWIGKHIRTGIYRSNYAIKWAGKVKDCPFGMGIFGPHANPDDEVVVGENSKSWDRIESDSVPVDVIRL